MNKYLKCVGMSLGLDLACVAVAVLVETKVETFMIGSIVLPLFSTLPAIGANVLDKYVNQNISDNKYFQYGATALEAGLINVGVGEAWYDFDGKYIKDLIKLQCSGNHWIFKLIFANAVAQGLLIDYILSQEKANEFGNGDGVLFGDDIPHHHFLI